MLNRRIHRARSKNSGRRGGLALKQGRRTGRSGFRDVHALGAGVLPRPDEPRRRGQNPLGLGFWAADWAAPLHAYEIHSSEEILRQSQRDAVVASGSGAWWLPPASTCVEHDWLHASVIQYLQLDVHRGKTGICKFNQQKITSSGSRQSGRNQ
jgi:hypothetical protein